MARIFWIGLGGFVGTVARYLLAGWVTTAMGPEFPWGTLAVNAAGSFLLAFLMGMDMHTGAMPPTFRMAITTGAMGGFTTYSTFNYETMRLLQERAWLMGALNIGATLLVCLVAGLLGWAAASLLFARQAA